MMREAAQIKIVPARSRRRRAAATPVAPPPPPPPLGRRSSAQPSSRSNLTACCRPIESASEQQLLQKHEATSLQGRRSSGAWPPRAADFSAAVERRREEELQSSPQQQQLVGGAAPPAPLATTDADFLQIKNLAMELQCAVNAARRIAEMSNQLSDSIARCEEALLQFSHAWLNRKLPETKKLLDELIDELLYVLGVSELQEVQRLALCLLSSTAMARAGGRSTEEAAEAEATGVDSDGDGDGGGEELGLGFSKRRREGKGLSSHDPQVLQALSNLLKQPARLPEAALLLHLLHPGRYTAACSHYLPHLLPLLLDLVEKNSLAAEEEAAAAAAGGGGGGGKARAMALMMMSRLLAAADAKSRRQSCRHLLYPGAIKRVMESLESGVAAAEEKEAAAFILSACMESGDECRSSILSRLNVSSLFSLLHGSSSATIASFHTAIRFASHVLCSTFRKLHMEELLQRFQQDGMLNCMHSLMSYIQMAPIENQPSAAGLLLQLDLLLGDGQRYSIFREEAIDALLSPLILDNNQEACMNAAHVLCTIGSKHSEQELEAWLLKKAGLASPHRTTTMQSKKGTMASSPSSSCDSKDGEDHDGVLGNWDELVSRALMSHKGGLKVSHALGKGLRTDLGEEVRRSCIMVVAWLTSHLIIENNILRITSSPQHNVGDYNGAKLVEGIEQFTQSIQPHLRSIVAIGSPYAIDERVFAALALQNLGLHAST